MPQPEDAGPREMANAQSQMQLLRRVRRMYIEKVVQKAEALAYDERVDMRSSLPHPMAAVANALAYTAVVSYWTTALLITTVYTVLLSSRDSLRWLYSCLSGWAFSLFVLEIVKALLVTILELQQLNQRRRLKDHQSLKDQVRLKKERKMKEMTKAAIKEGKAVPAGPLQLPVLPASGEQGGPPMPPASSADLPSPSRVMSVSKGHADEVLRDAKHHYSLHRTGAEARSAEESRRRLAASPPGQIESPPRAEHQAPALGDASAG